jgi:hypothetical protein
VRGGSKVEILRGEKGKSVEFNMNQGFPQQSPRIVKDQDVSCEAEMVRK